MYGCEREERQVATEPRNMTDDPDRDEVVGRKMKGRMMKSAV